MRKMEACLYIAPSDRAVLERLAADGKTPQKLAARARIVLLSGRGFGTTAIMREARVSKPSVWRWQDAYQQGGITRLCKDKGKGPKAGKPRLADEVRLKACPREGGDRHHDGPGEARERHALERTHAG